MTNSQPKSEIVRFFDPDGFYHNALASTPTWTRFFSKHGLRQEALTSSASPSAI